MRYSPEISFRYRDTDLNSEENEVKTNTYPKQADKDIDSGNFAKCARVLLKVDSSTGEKTISSNSEMSSHLDCSTASRHYNTREPSWTEDFIDLTEFCQPSTVPTKMEGSVDEQITSPIINTNTNSVRNHGYNSLELNDLEQSIDDNLWCMPSPVTMQEELCDPLTDWLAVTKESNNNISNNNSNNDNLPSRAEISYDIDDVLLNSRLTSSVPNAATHYTQKKTTLNFIIDEMASQQQQQQHQQQQQQHHHPSSGSSFFRPQNVFCDGNRNSASPLSENLILGSTDALIRLPPADSLFTDKHSEPSYALHSHNQFLEAAVPSMARISVSDTAVGTLSSPNSCSSSSPMQSSIPLLSQNQMEKTSAQLQQQPSRLKVDINRPTTSSGNSSLHVSEVLQPLVSKDSSFDLVSYVFEDNKSVNRLDVTSLRTKKLSAPSASDVLDSSSSQSGVTIKSEPNEESDDYAACGSSSFSKHKLVDDVRARVKRIRRYSNCSSEDLTQLESEKYRELRNKNNEASRRSRANRKTREVEMKEHAHQLESENRRLKVKAEEMEKLVKRLRNCLMQLVLKRR